MATFKVYILPFDEDGIYADEFIDVSSYVDLDSLGVVKQDIDNDQYNVGVFKFNQISITFLNDQGKFSEVDVFNSIFRFKRSDSILKITYAIQDFETIAGVAISGEVYVSEEEEVFRGLINDESSSMSLDNQKISFRVLGYESLFSKVETPYDDFVIGDTFSELIYKSLNLPLITDLMTVDEANINVGLDLACDAIEPLQNKTSKEALDTLLLLSNSILYIKDETIYVTSRDPTAEVLETFYGQASDIGIENIQEITDFKNGVNKVFNYWTWKDTTIVSRGIDSIIVHGVKKKEIDFDLITDSGKRTSIVDALNDEFETAKNELEITTPITYDSLVLFMLDKVIIDYPTVLTPAEGQTIPIYDVSIYDEDYYPIAQWSLTIPTTDFYKIMGRAVDMKQQLLRFKLREV